MNTKIVENLQNDPTELKKDSVNNSISKYTEVNHIELRCAFYEKCTLPKDKSLCHQFPDFMICTDFIARRNKIMNE